MSQIESVKVEVGKAIYVPTDWPGLEDSKTAQVFPVILSGDLSVIRKHFIVNARFPFLDQAQHKSVEAHLRQSGTGVGCSFIIHDSEGEAKVVADIDEANASAFEVAAAVAVVKASCGWDESNPIKVLVNDINVSAFAQFSGGEWVVGISNI